MSETRKDYAPRPSGHRVIETEAKPEKPTRPKVKPDAEPEEE